MSNHRPQLILALTILWSVFLLLPSTSHAAGTKKIGSTCSADVECISGDCENSTKSDASGKTLSYCDCGELDLKPFPISYSGSCQTNYGSPIGGGQWTCKDGAPATYDLDYCISTKDVRFPLPELDQNTTLKQTLIQSLFDPKIQSAAILQKIDSFAPKLEINLPGLTFSDISETIDEKNNIYIPWIGEFLSAVYKYGIAILSIIAVIMIIGQGVTIITTAGQDRAKAYKKIFEIFIGLGIAWGSYAILYNINPDLEAFKALKIEMVVPIPFSDLVYDESSTGESIDQRDNDLPGTPAQPFGSTTYDETFKKFAGCIGVNWEVYKLIVHHESGLRLNAKNPNSSATGLFQAMAGKDNRTCRAVLEKIGWSSKCDNPGLYDADVNTAYVTLITRPSFNTVKSKCPGVSIVDQLALVYHGHSSGPGAMSEGIRLYGCQIDNWPEDLWPTGTKYGLGGKKIFRGATKAYIKKFAAKATQYKINQLAGTKNTSACPIKL